MCQYLKFLRTPSAWFSWRRWPSNNLTNVFFFLFWWYDLEFIRYRTLNPPTVRKKAENNKRNDCISARLILEQWGLCVLLKKKHAPNKYEIPVTHSFIHIYKLCSEKSYYVRKKSEFKWVEGRVTLWIEFCGLFKYYYCRDRGCRRVVEPSIEKLKQHAAETVGNYQLLNATHITKINVNSYLLWH